MILPPVLAGAPLVTALSQFVHLPSLGIVFINRLDRLHEVLLLL